MKKMGASKDKSSFRMSAMEKRICITKVVANTHEALAKAAGVFRRAFIATGTWLPLDRSVTAEVSLQGVDFEYEAVCTPGSIEEHRKEIERLKVEKEEEERKAAELEKEKMNALANLFAPSVQKSEAIWSNMLPLVLKETTAKFQSIATHVKSSFICAGSFPAYTVVDVFSRLPEINENNLLKYNDIDIYTGIFGDGEIDRTDCSYVKIRGIDKEVNLITCSNLNSSSLLATCDINAVAVCVEVRVENGEVASVQ